MELHLENNVALVTGAGTGIGKAVAAMLANEAANVIVFLASEAASYVTGCSYGVTGGLGA